MGIPQIIATIGPRTVSQEMMKKLLSAGTDIFRFNFSHGTKEWFLTAFQNARTAFLAAQKKPELLLDTKGPEIRTGDIETPIQLFAGEKVILTTRKEDQNLEKKIIFVDYLRLSQDVSPGKIIEFDNGAFDGVVLETGENFCEVEIKSQGELGSRRHINLPGVRVHLPTVSPRDEEDILFGLDQGITSVAVSFARSSGDIEAVRKILIKANHPEVKVIAKIENLEGVKNFMSILEKADGIMVARGDLGVELPYEHIPALQKAMLLEAKKMKKFSIVATQMLESMIHSSQPTRAEVSDISTAVWEGADAIMLSGETAIGEYPVQAVESMHRVVRATLQDRDIFHSSAHAGEVLEEFGRSLSESNS